MTGVLLRRGEEVDTDTRGGDSPEATWRRLQAEEVDDRELEEARRVLPCSLWGDAGPAHTLTLCVCVCVHVNFDFIT